MRRTTEVFWNGRAWRHAPDSHDREWPEEPCNACRYCDPQGLCSQPEVDKEHPYGWTCQGECGRAELEEFDEDLEPEPDSIDEYAEDASVCVQILYEDLLNRRNPLKTILAAARIYEGVPAELLEEVRNRVEEEWKKLEIDERNDNNSN